MDILIPLGKGSRWQDNELRYCLRSVEKHLSGYGRIFIVGELPLWLTGVVHIPCNDVPGHWNRDKNIYSKIIAGCDDDRLSDDFLFMNDDHFLLKDIVIGDFPFFHQGLLEDKIDRMNSAIPYRKVLKNTVEYLKRYGFESFDFDIHCPIIYNRVLFKNMLPVNWDWPPYGYSIKSMYCNINTISGIESVDLKVSDKSERGTIYNSLKERSFFSIGDKCLHGDMKQVLEEIYPKNSKYEL